MKKIIIGVLVIIEIFSLYMMYQSNENKNLNEVNVKDNKINKNTFAIYWDENGIGEYKEYTKESWPGKGYILDLDNTKCMSEKGNKLNNDIIEYNSENNSLTLTSKSTAYCTLYFFLAEKEYNYTGNYQMFIAPKTGNYKIELWGASGGGAYYDIIGDDTNGYEKIGDYIDGGKGAYTKGIINLKKNEKLYIYVGEMGKNYSELILVDGNYQPLGGYNGGGYGGRAYQIGGGGGGATDVRLEITEDGSWNDFNSLKSRIMVAGAGGGTSNWRLTVSGGYAGGLIGENGILNKDSTSHQLATGGTQESGGIGACGLGCAIDGKFGIGGHCQGDHGGGGGAGYYGGGGGSYIDGGVSSGAGGSSFISGYPGCKAIDKNSTEDHISHLDTSEHYSGKVFTDYEMITGSEEMPTHNGEGTMEGNTGNGYAKITFVN